MDDFISEEELQTFDGFLRYQAVSPSSATELEEWRRVFEEAQRRSALAPKIGLMKLQPVPGEYGYATALRDGADLWLTLWVRRSWRGEFFVMLPRADTDWDPHTSYHLVLLCHESSFGAVTAVSGKMGAGRNRARVVPRTAVPSTGPLCGPCS